MNDPDYAALSDAVAQLPNPTNRAGVLARIRQIGRKMLSSPVISTGWNYLAKVIKVWTGVPLPEARAIATLVTGRSFPTLVSLGPARERALTMWLASGKHDKPCRRSGAPFSDEGMYWLPPIRSIPTPKPGESMLSLGTVGELRDLLLESKDEIAKQLAAIGGTVEHEKNV